MNSYSSRKSVFSTRHELCKVDDRELEKSKFENSNDHNGHFENGNDHNGHLEQSCLGQRNTQKSSSTDSGNFDEGSEYEKPSFERSTFENSEHLYINVDYSGAVRGQFKSTKFWNDDADETGASREYTTDHRDDTEMMMMEHCENHRLQTKPPRAPAKVAGYQNILLKAQQQRKISAWLQDVNKESSELADDPEDYGRSRRRFGSQPSPATSNIHRYRSRALSYSSDAADLATEDMVRTDLVPEDSVLNDSYQLADAEVTARRQNRTIDSDASFFIYCPLVSKGVTNGGKVSTSKSRRIVKKLKKLRKRFAYTMRRTKVTTTDVL